MERTLLLVDDEENMPPHSLCCAGTSYRILRANSGEAGLELLAQNEVGVIIFTSACPE